MQRRKRLAYSFFAPDYQCVDPAAAGAALHDDQWVDVDFGDFTPEVVREPRQPHDQVAQAFDVARRHAAHAVEQLAAAQFIHHCARVRRRDRRDAIADVTQHLDVDAAEPRGNDGPEYRVANNAEHHLDALRHHFLHQYAVDAGIRRVARGGVQHLRISDTHRVVALQAELDRAGIGLVRDVD